MCQLIKGVSVLHTWLQTTLQTEILASLLQNAVCKTDPTAIASYDIGG